MKTVNVLLVMILAGFLSACISEIPTIPENSIDQLSLIKKTDDLSPIDLNSTDVVAKKNEKVTVDIVNTISSEVTGKSTLHRNENGITINFKTNGLIPGHAYTLWWGVWNKPENCGIPGECVESDLANAVNVEVQLLYAGGHVSGGNGSGNFSAHLKENDDSGSIHELFGLPNFGGLQNAETAEIHAVLRSHGPKIPGKVNEQITTYQGGCEINFPPFTTIPVNPGECGDIFASIHRL